MTTQQALDELVVDVVGLRKSFGSFHALDGLDLQVRQGEVHGFLGPNGAGKSTTIRILLGLVRSSDGQAKLFGGDPWHDAVRLHRRLAYVPGDVSLWPGLTGGECIDVIASPHGGLPPDRRAELIERFDLDPSKRSDDYSKGNRQKVALVAALAADVDLLVLDEPTSGLDPLMEKVFQDTVRERTGDGVTVLLSSHILSEVESLADRVTIIRKGKTVTTGTLAEMRQHARTSVHAVTKGEPVELVDRGGIHELAITPGDGRFDVTFHVDTDRIDDAIGVVHAAGLHSLTAEPPSLDDLFLTSYYGNSAHEGTQDSEVAS
ncbi:MAG TPA: ABC transporter ATP-binding protein [Nocardioidaceae bacterium]|nr:ABC transporter ATP-binding protein [Nocardioidaceae bacterium]